MMLNKPSRDWYLIAYTDVVVFLATGKCLMFMWLLLENGKQSFTTVIQVFCKNLSKLPVSRMFVTQVAGGIFVLKDSYLP